jgi:hypothetical protein
MDNTKSEKARTWHTNRVTVAMPGSNDCRKGPLMASPLSMTPQCTYGGPEISGLAITLRENDAATNSRQCAVGTAASRANCGDAGFEIERNAHGRATARLAFTLALTSITRRIASYVVRTDGLTEVAATLNRRRCVDNGSPRAIRGRVVARGRLERGGASRCSCIRITRNGLKVVGAGRQIDCIALHQVITSGLLP